MIHLNTHIIVTHFKQISIKLHNGILGYSIKCMSYFHFITMLLPKLILLKSQKISPSKIFLIWFIFILSFDVLFILLCYLM